MFCFNKNKKLERRTKTIYHIENAAYWEQGDMILNQPHTLIAGCTRCGKSTLIHKLMWTALAYTPDEKQFIIIDMKEVEMIRYQGLPHVLRYADTEKDALPTLDYAIAITRARLNEMKAKRVVVYDGPDLYIVIDELGFLLQACGTEALNRITLLGRIAAAAKVHLVMATQDPSRKGCPSAIQVNCTCCIGMKCKSAMESRQIIGMSGCENLPKYGTAFMVIGSDISTLPIVPKSDEEYAERIAYWMSDACKKEV